VAVAGPVDRETGVVSNPWTLASLAGADVRSPFAKQFGVPVIVENDTDAAALGEYVYGAGRGVDSLAMVTLGTGVGVALVHDGSLLRGTGGYHAEAGHHSIADSGPVCYCGLVGCWESLASGTALERDARAAIDEGAWLPEQTVESAEDVTAAADRGDPFAQALLDDLGFHVGRGLRNVEAFFAPATIAIGGGLGTRLDLLSAGIERGRLPGSALNLRAEVVRASLGDSAGALGAACAIRNHVT
jgi:glucokinase